MQAECSQSPRKKRQRKINEIGEVEPPPSTSTNKEDDQSSSKHHYPLPLPNELSSVDFTKRVVWGKFQPYSASPLPTVTNLDTPPVFLKDSSPALCHHVNACSGRARACTIHLQQPTIELFKQSRPIPTPIFMPVGTKGCLKGVSLQELCTDPGLQCPIILANTYHLAIQPGTDVVREMGGLHNFQGLQKAAEMAINVEDDDDNHASGKNSFLSYNLLTDSGGFQMVSLVKLSKVTEEGVSFENPFRQEKPFQKLISDHAGESKEVHKSNMMLLRPEDSIQHQNNIGANIIMALDDVVSSATCDEERFQTATYRTLRWYDRCYAAHARPETQNLFPIIQGGLDVSIGGLREQCLAGFRRREQELGYKIPGYAIGGLAGGEDKNDFWRVVDQCCRALPDDRPRYLMGVGYPLDLVVCTGLGVDMYDCVYPTRTARFGVALVPGPAPGTLKVKAHDCADDDEVIQQGCPCQACRQGISRARLHALFKAGNAVAVELITQHNLAYMMQLVNCMRKSILDNSFPEFAIRFVKDQYPGEDGAPVWVVDALAAAGIDFPQKA